MMRHLSGRTIMIVEDDYLDASELARHFLAANAQILGPFPTVSAALHHSDQADMAILDLHLWDRKVYPLADQLMSSAIPFVFYSSEDMTDIPHRFAYIPRLPKPLATRQAATLLACNSQKETISSLMPWMRLSARLILKDPLAADRLVEATLMLALHEQKSLDEIPNLAEWLQFLMDQVLAARGRDLMN